MEDCLAKELKKGISIQETLDRHITMKFINSFYQKEKELHDDFSIDNISVKVKELLELFKMKPEHDLIDFEKEIIHSYLKFVNDGDVEKLIEEYTATVKKYDHAPHSQMLKKALLNFNSIL